MQLCRLQHLALLALAAPLVVSVATGTARAAGTLLALPAPGGETLGLAAPAMPAPSAAEPADSADPLQLVPALALGEAGEGAVYAQRAVTRDLGRAPAPDAANGPAYKYVEVQGWKTPAAAAGMSLAVPGAGQIYTGSSRGYVFLGVEAIAVAAFVKYHGDSRDKRDQYYGYVGDPNQAGSRFSFDRLASSVSPEELTRLKEIYAKDPGEFYDIVTTNDSYASGWGDPQVGGAEARTTADSYRSDVNDLSRKSRLGLFFALANHVASTIDALHLARLNNVAITKNLSLKLKMHPGNHSNYGLTLTQAF